MYGFIREVYGSYTGAYMHRYFERGSRVMCSYMIRNKPAARRRALLASSSLSPSLPFAKSIGADDSLNSHVMQGMKKVKKSASDYLTSLCRDEMEKASLSSQSLCTTPPTPMAFRCHQEDGGHYPAMLDLSKDPYELGFVSFNGSLPSSYIVDDHPPTHGDMNSTTRTTMSHNGMDMDPFETSGEIYHSFAADIADEVIRTFRFV